MKIRELTIPCKDISVCTGFYSHVFGPKVESSINGEATFRLGSSLLKLQSHNHKLEANFPNAFSVQLPGNKVREAQLWLKNKGLKLFEQTFADFGQQRSIQGFMFKDPEGNVIEFHAYPELYNPTQEPFGVKHILGIDSLVYGVRLLAPVIHIFSHTDIAKDCMFMTQEECALGAEHCYLHVMNLKRASDLHQSLIKDPSQFEAVLEMNNGSIRFTQHANRMELHEL